MIQSKYHRSATRLALLLCAMLVQQFALAPLAWAACGHHFDLFGDHDHTADVVAVETANTFAEQVAAVPMCGEQRQQTSAADEQTPGSSPSGTAHCLCGDGSCNLASASVSVAQPPLVPPVSWQVDRRVPLPSVPTTATPRLLPDANAPPGLVHALTIR